MSLIEHCARLLESLAGVGHVAHSLVPSDYAIIIDCCHQITQYPRDADAVVDEDELNLICENRLLLWQEFAQCHPDFLCHYQYDDGDGGTGERFCFGELIFSAICRLDIEILWTRRIDVAATADQIGYCIERALIIESARGVPFIQYSPAQILDALDLLRNTFYQCHFHQELQQYIELLEMATAWTVYFERPYNPTAFYDTDRAIVSDALLSDHIVGGQDDPVFERATITFAHATWPTLLGMHRQIFDALNFGDENVDIDPALEYLDNGWQAAVEPHIHSLLATCAANKYTDASNSLRECHLVAHMRPGDREAFKLTSPSTSKSDGGIVSDSLGDPRMKVINAELQLSPLEGVKRFLEPLIQNQSQNQNDADRLKALVGREPGWFGLCLHDLLDMATQGMPGNDWAEFYSRRARDVRADPTEILFLSRRRPMLVQLFNHWQLIYMGRVYWYNSALLSYVAWWQLRRVHLNMLKISFCELFSCPPAACFILPRRRGVDTAENDQRILQWAKRMLLLD